MNTEQTNENILIYIKTHYGEAMLPNIQKLEKSIGVIMGEVSTET